MELALKIFFTRSITILSIVIQAVLLTIFFVTGNEGFEYFGVISLLSSSAILLLTYRICPKRFIPYLFPLYQLIFLIITSETRYAAGESLPSGGYILYPIYTFFLLGVKHGLLFSALLGIWSLSIPFTHNVGLEVFGKFYGIAYPFLFLFSLFLCLFLEQIRGKLLKRMSFLSTHDELTALLNRTGFLDTLEEYIDKNKTASVVIFDYDHFTKINTYLGHSFADNVLIETARFLSEKEGIIPARWYGDQFVFCTNASKEVCKSILIDLQKFLETSTLAQELDISLSFSASIVEYPFHGDTVSKLMITADIALLESKKRGKGEIHFFNETGVQNHQKEIAIENDLASAIKNEDIKVFFQPKIGVKTGKVSGMEALSRWIHPEYGYIIPPDFVKASEKIGNTHILGEYVFEKAFNHLKQCHDLGYTDLSVSVNVSPLHLIHKNFLPRLVTICNSCKVKPTSVILEITEDVMVQDDIKHLVDDLRLIGFRVSLDDFGTGYSSLSYLSRFHFDELKIDKSFTDRLLLSESDKGLFTLIVSFSNLFKMKTVVEGLETEEQKDLVKELGIDEIQGWFYLKAVPEEEFIEYLRERNGAIEVE